MLNEQGHTLKNRLQELIAGRKVKAALFYTFNFDPRFFENYVMPLLVPDQTFINNSIANNILWRKLYKDNLVPPVTVYFDQDVKSIDNGPYLDYHLVPVNMPMVGKNKGNFHPKQSLILIENDAYSAELIIITGSNNLTQLGWCENIECVSEQILINGKSFPYEFRLEIKNFIETTFKEYSREWSAAEELIYSYLNKIGYTKDRECYFYNSYQRSFVEFLYGLVLADDSIKQLEIISPYFQKSADLVTYFTERNIKVKIQAPFKDGFCLLEKTVFHSYEETGAQWYYPHDETRNSHSKVYRFYGDDRIYTFVGSVNLTEPAWNGFVERPKQIYNIESGVLYIEQKDKPYTLLKKQIKDDKVKFIPPATSDENWFERIEIPEIDFTINWLDKTLSWKSKLKNECKLHLTASDVFLIERSGIITLSDLKNGAAIIDSIARKPVLTVIEKVKEQEYYTHYYYINQIGFECRPLEFRFSATDIIDAWDLLESANSELNDWIINRLELATDLLQDESGKLIANTTTNKSLLNEMARHFYGLVKLERFLFSESILTKNNKAQCAHLNNIRYYLTYDNVDTLLSYIKDLQKLHSNGSFMTVYYWLILNIILSHFYENKLLGKMIRNLYGENIDRNETRKAIDNILNTIREELERVENNVNIDRKKIKWALSILQSAHEFSN